MFKQASRLALGLCFLLALAGCDGGDEVTGPFPPVTPPDYSGTYTVRQIVPVEPPFGTIDADFLDGVIPDAVNYDIMSGRLWRYAALQHGALTLSRDGTYSLELVFGRYEPAEGDDGVPYQSCVGTAGDTYVVEDDTLSLRALDDRDGHKKLRVAGTDTLMLDGLWNTCSYTAAGTVYNSDFFLEGPVLVREHEDP